jgi:glycosyltransferase involved in cell wall biosynthesis
MLQQKSVAVVVPAYNEERLVGATIDSVPQFVDHIVVVDDGSSDATSARVCARGDSRVLLARHEGNRGVGAALVTGYRIAFAKGADIAVVMAGDGQMDPGDLLDLLRPLLDGEADYVKGDRLSHPDVRGQMPWTRWIGNRLFSWLTCWALGVTVSDSQCGYTALSRHIARRVPLDQLWYGYGYPNDLLGWLTLAGARICEVPVKPVYGQEISGVGLRHALWVIPGVLGRVWLRRIKGVRGLPQPASEPHILQLSQSGETPAYFP